MGLANIQHVPLVGYGGDGTWGRFDTKKNVWPLMWSRVGDAKAAGINTSANEKVWNHIFLVRWNHHSNQKHGLWDGI
jgi:hypothetical protein